MDFLTDHITDELVNALTGTIFHSLWQGAVITVVLYLVLTRVNQARMRYNLSVGALVMLLAASISTFLILWTPSTVQPTDTTVLGISEATIASTPALAEAGHFLADHNTLILSLWITGFLLFLVKWIGSYIYVLYLRSGRENHDFDSTVSALKKQLSLNKEVILRLSKRVRVPMVIGYAKPIVLFPIGMINGLSSNEVACILAHELAHIKRNDYLINLFITLAESLYYFHPAVWWINSVIQNERENSCDDIVLSLDFQRIDYANALMKLQEIQLSQKHKGLNTPLAMTLASNKNQLLNRIKRILNINHKSINMNHKPIITLAALVGILLFSNQLLTGKTSENESIVHTTVEKIEDLRQSQSLLTPRKITIDTFPKQKSRIQIFKDVDGKSMSLSMENGEIKELKIDGKVIPKKDYDKYENMTDDIIILDNGDGMSFNGDSIFMRNFNFNFDDDRFDQLFEGMQGMMHAMPQDFDFQELFEGLGGEEGFEKLQNQLKDLGGGMYMLRDSLGSDSPFFYQFDDENRPFERLDENFHEFDTPRRSNKVVDIIGSELNRDGLLEPFKQNSVELTGKYLKINGDKQPKNIWGKYKRLYEERTGMQLSKRSRLDFQVEGKKSNRRLQGI